VRPGGQLLGAGSSASVNTLDNVAPNAGRPDDPATFDLLTVNWSTPVTTSG
jgi:hypothetical protein